MLPGILRSWQHVRRMLPRCAQKPRRSAIARGTTADSCACTPSDAHTAIRDVAPELHMQPDSQRGRALVRNIHWHCISAAPFANNCRRRRGLRILCCAEERTDLLCIRVRISRLLPRPVVPSRGRNLAHSSYNEPRRATEVARAATRNIYSPCNPVHPFCE